MKTNTHKDLCYKCKSDLGYNYYITRYRSNYEYHSNRICSTCADKLIQCDACACFVEQDFIKDFNGDDVCLHCWEDICECSSCGRYCWSHDFDDNNVCVNCVENEDEDENYDDEFLEIVGASYVSDRRYGIELETVGTNTINSNWKRVHDGSIEPNGYEYCSPIFSGDCEDHIKDFLSKARQKKLSVNKSCGFHLHIESKDFTDEDLIKCYILSKNIEDWIKQCVSPSRRNNRYCVDLPKDLPNDRFDGFWYNQSMNTPYEITSCNYRKNEKYDDTRYKWINFHSHYYRGTIEIRLHQGTLNPDKIINWIKLWLCFFDYVKKSSLEEIKLTKDIGFLPYYIVDYYNNRASQIKGDATPILQEV